MAVSSRWLQNQVMDQLVEEVEWPTLLGHAQISQKGSLTSHTLLLKVPVNDRKYIR